MRGKDFLTLAELTPQDLKAILDLAARLKGGRASGLGRDALDGKTVALIFE